MNEKALEKWKSSWDSSIHESDYAAKRIKSAKSAKLTPIKIDTDDCYGYFQGTHGRYETWLDLCPCGDFIRSKLPCKHIYRLAIELGIMNEEAATDQNAIPEVNARKISLSETLDIVETLSQEAQHVLWNIASSTTSNNPFEHIDADEIAEELIKSGIISDDGTGINETVIFGTKPEIISFLKKNNIEHNKSDKKNVLEELCMTVAPDAAAEYFRVRHWYNVRIPAIYSRQQIHFYLHRKYDSEYVFDEDGNYLKVPLLETDLPDDKVTDELIKRG
jgi:hypothetical protein